MGMWSVIVPRTTELVNLVTNPSVETDTVGYTAVGGSIARILGNARRGAYYLNVIPTVSAMDGVYFGTVPLVDLNTYWFSCDFKGVAGVPYKIWFATTAGVLLGTATTFTATGEWERPSVSYNEVSVASRRLYITKASSASIVAFKVDGLLCVESAANPEYFDGDSPGGKWSVARTTSHGTKHFDKSVMDPQWRGAGSKIDFSTYEVNVTAELGIGIPGMAHQTTEQALLSGALFRGRKVLPRTVELKCQIKGDNWSDLHALRAALWDAIKPDLVRDDQAFIMRYSGSGKDLDLYCVYDSGLEMGNPDMYLDQFNLRCIAYDPFWYEDGNDCNQILSNTSFTFRYYGSRINQRWNTTNTPSAVTDPGSGISVRAITVGPNGYIYVGGEFLNWDAIAAADYIVYFNPTIGTWNAMGSGANGIVRGIAVGPDGRVYACGHFTSIGGTAANRIAVWNGSTWAALGTGLNAAAYALDFAPDGKLYVGGLFTTAGGTTVNYIAVWNGSAWAALDTSLDGAVSALKVAKNGDVYAGGVFTTAGSYIAKWNGSAWSALGTGMNAYVYAIAIGPDGTVYAGGLFTTAGGSAADAIAKWNGAGWFPLGSGVSGGSGRVFALQVAEDGLLYVGGDFTSAGGLTLADCIAIWNGSSWAHLDIDLPGTASIYAICCDGDELYLGFNTTGTASCSWNSSVTNKGSRSCQPKLVINRSGGTSARVEYLKNLTTGATIWLNYALLDGETLTINFQEGERKIESSMFGDVWRAMLRNSDFGEFTLLPGINEILSYVNEAGSPTITNYLTWKNMFWSADG